MKQAGLNQKDNVAEADADAIPADFRQQKSLLIRRLVTGAILGLSLWLIFSICVAELSFEYQALHSIEKGLQNLQFTISFLAVPVLMWSFFFHNLSQFLAYRFKSEAPFSEKQCLLTTVLAIISAPIPPRSHFLHSLTLDPFFLIWVLFPSILYFLIGRFLEEKMLGPGRKTYWRGGLTLALCASAPMLAGWFGLMEFSIMNCLLSQLWGLSYVLYICLNGLPREDSQRGGAKSSIQTEPLSTDQHSIIPYQESEGLFLWFKQRMRKDTQKRSNREQLLRRSILLWFAIPLVFIFATVSTPVVTKIAYMVRGDAADLEESTGAKISRDFQKRKNKTLSNTSPKTMLEGAEGGTLLQPEPPQKNRSGESLVLIVSAFILTTLAAIAAVIKFLITATHFQIGRNGIRFLIRRSGTRENRRTTPWDEITQIDIMRPPGKTSPIDDVLRFARKDKKPVLLKLSGISTIAGKEALLKAIQTFAPSTVIRDARLQEALQPPADHSYTELWLQALSAPPQRERLNPLMPGAKLQEGRLKVIDSLGVGGQGQAYLALDTETKQEIVLKEFLLPLYVDIDVRRAALVQFENEARILCQLDHPQIVKLFGFFVEDHRAYLMLEHIKGSNLRTLVQSRGRFSETEVREFALQICRILEHLHGLTPPVVHRDFTPDNLILQPDGLLKLIDFNVAKQIESTATGTVVGKHAYLPPEQFRGKPVSQSDIYAMGATLFYLLTGHDPEALTVSSPIEAGTDTTESLDQIVRKMTSLDLKLRYQNAEEIRRDLEQSCKIDTSCKQAEETYHP